MKIGPKGFPPVIILAGGLGTRLSEETEVKPKPMVEIGGRPILWHILKHYGHYQFNEFVVALGYKGELIKSWFLNYRTLSSDVSISLKTGKTKIHKGNQEDWTVHLMDTGAKTNTGGRIKRLEPLLKGGPFLLTYGDGVSSVDLKKLMGFHKSTGLLATLTAVRPPSRFGGLVFDKNRVIQFSEKPQIGEGWINGGYMVIEPRALKYIKDDDTNFERDVLERLASEGQLAAYRHEGFWQCMDTLRDVRLLESLWNSGKAPWKVW